MLPQEVASSIAVNGLFMSPDNALPSPLIDYEMGGVAIGNASAGLLVQPWTCFYDSASSAIMLQPQGGEAVSLFNYGGVLELSFAFDQNMRPAVAFNVNGTLYLRWFDSTVTSFVITSFGTGRNPRLTLDDKRPETIGLYSDIIFAYLRGDTLYYRQQRDRFLIEYTFRTGIDPTLKLANVGMTNQLRLQFELV